MPKKTPALQKPDGIERRKVVMTNATAKPGGVIETHAATDYVPIDDLDAYVADAQTRWQLIEVGTEPDNGPGFSKE